MVALIVVNQVHVADCKLHAATSFDAVDDCDDDDYCDHWCVDAICGALPDSKIKQPQHLPRYEATLQMTLARRYQSCPSNVVDSKPVVAGLSPRSRMPRRQNSYSLLMSSRAKHYSLSACPAVEINQTKIPLITVPPMTSFQRAKEFLKFFLFPAVILYL